LSHPLLVQAIAVGQHGHGRRQEYHLQTRQPKGP